jgi:hypothetical protein
MAGKLIRIPLLRTYLYRRFVYELELTVGVRTAQGTFLLLPFLFDTGTHLTTMPLTLAQQLGIPFSTAHPVTVRGTTGKGQGFLSPLWFAFPQLPHWQFESLCCFTPHPLKRALLSLTDLIAHFHLRTAPATALHPLGSVILRLRPDHGGRPRP